MEERHRAKYRGMGVGGSWNCHGLSGYTTLQPLDVFTNLEAL